MLDFIRKSAIIQYDADNKHYHRRLTHRDAGAVRQRDWWWSWGLGRRVPVHHSPLLLSVLIQRNFK